MIRSLNSHLRQSESHARLPFHPECPVCRQARLVGEVATNDAIPPRLPALIAAGVLAASGAAPASTALAQGGPQPSSPAGGSDPANDPDLDGGDSDPAADEPTPVAPGDDSGPAEQAPAPTPAPAAGAETGSAAPSAPAPAPAPSATEPASPPPAESATPAAPAPVATPPVQAAPAAPSVPRPRAFRALRRDRQPHVGIVYIRRVHHSPARVVRPVTSSRRSSTVVVVHQAALRPRPVAYIEARGVRADGKTHVVRSGESLWSIANAVLGGRATPAQIAREVHKLWTLNSARIGTGDPDLIRVGTRLVLR